MQETTRDKFVRLAEARTNRVLKQLELLGNLSNRSNYSYSEADVETILSVVRKKLRETELRFEAGLAAKAKSDFRL